MSAIGVVICYRSIIDYLVSSVYRFTVYFYTKLTLICCFIGNNHNKFYILYPWMGQGFASCSLSLNLLRCGYGCHNDVIYGSIGVLPSEYPRSFQVKKYPTSGIISNCTVASMNLLFSAGLTWTVTGRPFKSYLI